MDRSPGRPVRYIPRRSGNSNSDDQNENTVRVWVGNIPPSVNFSSLISALRECELPTWTHVLLRKGAHRNFAFISFTNHEDATLCAQILHHRRVFPDSDLPLKAQLETPRDGGDLSSTTANSDDLKVTYGGNRQRSGYRRNMTSTTHVYEMLQDADESTLWHVYKNEDGIPYYYNHITGCTQWESPVPPLVAVANSVNERTRGVSPDGANLFIFHIPPCWTDKDLAMHFTPFGNVVSARVQKDGNGHNAGWCLLALMSALFADTADWHSGFGFVSYDNCQSAAAALRLMKGYATNSKFLKVEYKIKDSPRS
ncbi:-CUGBP Elav-like family member 1 [Babesia bigemina]|uniref:-CUGBP Elav-like family member 1 n=1 Tax=Babesia bigemina TaxID=5866 RepID=A0A061DB04_BABBI|nr:-CUGBP Elav-like family member 1 [Babesia bigemina]CDR97846.1 -CUGBP Elav-like family member 1 [Babesia bigemina]|eukprot:XP_012770032.1 -CUGBP Elav-like family member 1 [Babesia bigemina]